MNYEDVMQILEDPKAAAWELRDLAKDLLEEVLAWKSAASMANRADTPEGLRNFIASCALGG